MESHFAGRLGEGGSGDERAMNLLSSLAYQACTFSSSLSSSEGQWMMTMSLHSETWLDFVSISGDDRNESSGEIVSSLQEALSISLFSSLCSHIAYRS
jgi:hypothetical protein